VSREPRLIIGTLPASDYSAYLSQIQRAEERTRTAYPCSSRVITQALQGFAGNCKSRISKGISLLCLAPCCTVLRSRWYQSGIRSRWRAPLRYSCKQGLKDGRRQDGLGVIQPNPPDVLSELTVSFDKILCQATQPTVPELISVSVSLSCRRLPYSTAASSPSIWTPRESRFTPQPGNTTVLSTNG
jgi:hypothetical protein